MKCEYENFEITTREILVAIAISLALIGFGFVISGAIKNRINESNEIYYKSLKINNDEELFKYAIKTNIGYTLAQGKIKAVDGVSIDDISGTYFFIKKVKEKYTKHYREVEHTRIKSDGKTETYYTTEEYWTWDFVEQEEFHTEKFSFLGENFDYGTINFNNESYKETKSADYHIRYKYYVIPFEFDGTLFTYIENNNITQNIFSMNATIEEIIQEKESSINVTNIIFWILWCIFIGTVDIFYISLENKYLED